ncbi:MAG: hypothetical protein AAF495_26365 [Pseudomonadota bacterium]
MIRIDRTRIFLLIILTSVGLTWLSAPAEAAKCSAPSTKPKIHLRMKYAEPTYVQDRNTAGMRNVINDIQGYTSGPWHLPLGLTIANFGTSYQTQMTYRKAKGGGYCVALSEATITVGYEDMTIYLSRDYAEGSCEFDAILEHELEHVAINEGVLRSYKTKFQEALKRVLRSKRVIFVHRKQEARSAYLLEFQRQFEPVARKMMRARDQKNAKIDTRASYERVHAKCSNW